MQCHCALQATQRWVFSSVVIDLKLIVFLQSAAVKGKVNLMCDAWQVENTNGYFVVMGHWVEEEL